MLKLHCNRGLFASAFQVVSAVVPTRTPKAVLQNVKLQAAGGKATLLATDSEIAIRYAVPEVEVEGHGEVLLPSRRLIEILREMRDDKVTLEIDDDSVTIRGSQSEFRLPVEDPAEFPNIAEFEDEKYFSVMGKALQQMIRRTIFATDVESTRYALGGILLELGSDKLGLVATDTRRLAVTHVPASAEGGVTAPPVAPVIPSKTMQLLDRTIPDDESEVHIAVHHPHDVLFQTANATLFSRLVEGRFPKYQDVIPQEEQVVIELVSGSFLTVIRQAQIFTSEESRGVDFHFSSGQLELKSQAPEMGQSRVTLPISYEGSDLQITFDPRYIADFLKVLPPETSVKLKLNTEDDAAVLATDDGYIYVIMPLTRDRN